MRRRRLALWVIPAVGPVLGMTGPAVAAVWEGSQVLVSPPLTNATVGVGGRTAVVDPAGRVHLVFQENITGGAGEVFYISRDPGGAWGSPARLSQPDTIVRNASIARGPDGTLHVVWEDATQSDEDVGHVMLIPGGGWTLPELVLPAPGFSRFPIGAVDNFGKFHVVWLDGRNAVQRILHAVWSAEAGWSGAHTLSIGGSSPQDATLDADQLGGIHVFWSDRTNSDPRDPIWSLIYTRLDAASSAIPGPTVLVQGNGLAVRPFVEARDDGTIHLVWLDDRTSTRTTAYEIFYKRYLPGIGWGKDKRFTYDGTNHGRPVIVEGAGESLNIVWEDYRQSAPDIYYRQITPAIGWDREITPLTTDVTSSQNPALVSLPGGKLLLIWSDSQETGSFRVLCKEGLAAPTP